MTLSRSSAALGWSRPTQAAWLICRGATFATSMRVALVVGTLLTLVNQGAALWSGPVDLPLMLRVVANYLIPYVVSGVGYLSSFRMPPGREPGLRRVP